MIQNSNISYQKHLKIKFIKTKKDQDSDYVACNVIIPNVQIDLNLLLKVKHYERYTVFNAEKYQMIIRLVCFIKKI